MDATEPDLRTPAQIAVDLEAAAAFARISNRTVRFSQLHDVMRSTAGAVRELRREIAGLNARIETLEARPASLSYEGIWTADKKYTRGQFVTSSGSVWHCESDSIGVRPGSVSGPWRLAVKAGRDAKPQELR